MGTRFVLAVLSMGFMFAIQDHNVVGTIGLGVLVAWFIFDDGLEEFFDV